MLTELEKRRNFPLSLYRTIASLNSRLMKIDNRNIESHLKEKRVFEPRKDFAKKARIKNAPLRKGSPSWGDIMELTWEEIEERKQRGEPGFKTIHKLLKSKEYDKE